MKRGNKKSLRIRKNTKKPYGAYVYAVIGNYKSRGKPKLILHEIEVSNNGEIYYGHKRHWVFGVKP